MTEINTVQVTEKKPWYKSKTIWFNTVVAMLATLEATAHVIQPYVSGNVFAYGMLILTMGNAGLRIITTQGIGK
ncbi:MAG TPA: hypothetical protein DCG63_03825 [Methylophilaceae bacterium]|nr:hypothetical protein [Methylophilaceae bacterium]